MITDAVRHANINKRQRKTYVLEVAQLPVAISATTMTGTLSAVVGPAGGGIVMMMKRGKCCCCYHRNMEEYVTRQDKLLTR